jgi:hypothetical protein
MSMVKQAHPLYPLWLNFGLVVHKKNQGLVQKRNPKRNTMIKPSLSVVVKKTSQPRRTVILSKLTVVSSFEEWFVLEVGAG